jgi:hypothetical protein
MNKPVLLAAVASLTAVLPTGALAQEGAPRNTPQQSACASHLDAPRADSSLPARASTKPEPQLGSVAPSTRLPSHTVTPSSRAMAAARASAEKTDKEDKDARLDCAGEAKPPPPGKRRNAD